MELLALAAFWGAVHVYDAYQSHKHDPQPRIRMSYYGKTYVERNEPGLVEMMLFGPRNRK
jgi:hypothetical protein